MKKNYSTPIYIGIWLLVIVLLGFLISQMYGDSRVINYSGIVRGCTERLVKQELYEMPNDDLITYLDDIIYDLQTGDGIYSLRKETDTDYQAQLETVNQTWIQLKEAIALYRSDSSYAQQVYTLSELHYGQADELVGIGEQVSANKIIRFVCFYLMSTLIAVASVVFYRKMARKKLEASRVTDSLTGTMIPRIFAQEAQSLVLKNENERYVVFAVDIVNFKKINVTHGYHCGDALLCAIANGLMTYESPKFLVSRITTDVFYVLTQWQKDMEDVLQCVFADVIKNAPLNATFQSEPVGFRFGGCSVGHGAESVKSAMEHAHLAHKIANSEKKSFVWCDEALLKQLNRDKYIEEHFSKALAQKEFRMYLQPQINLQARAVTSAESLVRWKTSDGTLLFPDDFIPYLEKKRLISQLDYYMLEQVCAYQGQRQSAGRDLHVVAVNFSRVTLTETDFYQKVLDTMAQHHIPHGCIAIEIVETALNTLSKKSLEQLSALKEMGVKVAIDDFGSGYSNLSELGDLPIHVLKLDKEFLWRAAQNEKIHSIIVSVIDMSHKIGLKVICEGVETQAHVDFLYQVGCDYAQGYFYSKPVAKEDYHWWDTAKLHE